MSYRGQVRLNLYWYGICDLWMKGYVLIKLHILLQTSPK